MDLAAITKSLGEIESITKAANADVTKQLTSIKEHTTKTDARLLDLEQKSAESGRRGPHLTTDAVPSFGELLAADAQFQSFQGGKTKHVSLTIKQSIGAALRTKSLLTNTGQSGDSPQVNFPSAPEYITPSPIAAPGRRLLVLQALPRQPVANTASVIVPKVTSTSDGSGAQQYEGAVKGESTISVTGQALELPSVATYLNASRQVLSDVTSLQPFLNAWLQFFVLRALESLVISGDGGSTDKILGLIHGGTPYVGISDHAVDRIGEACAIALPDYGYAPGLIILSPLDYCRILSERSPLDQKYIAQGFVSAFNGTMWGTPVVSSPGCPTGIAVVLDTALVSIIDREEIHVEIGFTGNQFTSNEATVLAELRATLAINDPHAIQVVTLPVNSPNF